MTLLNGEYTNRVLNSQSSHLVQQLNESSDSKKDKVERMFLSILSRYPTSEDRSAAQSAMRVDKDEVQAKGRAKLENPELSNVIWALINTREFLFIQ